MAEGTAAPPQVRDVSLREAFWVWFRIGWLGFGGPAGQIALMHRELVERRRWISEARFLHALNYCMLLPGPEAQQLSVYIGWLMHRTLGGLIAGVLFVLPGALVLVLLSALYVHYGNTVGLAALFFGLKAAVLALVIEAVLRIGRRALKTRFHLVVAAAAFIAIFLLAVPFPWIVLAAAFIGIAVQRWMPAWSPLAKAEDAAVDANCLVDRLLADPKRVVSPSWRRAARVTAVCLLLWFAPLLVLQLWLGNDHVIVREGLFFSQTAVVTFGGAYAVLAYVAQRAVEQFAWLQPAEMLDGLALAETTPGPLIMVLQFVGFVAAYRHAGVLDPWTAAMLGAAVTTWVTFVPCFLFVFVGAPYVEALRRHAATRAALSCITAAVVGVVLNLSAWFALHSLFGEVRSIEWLVFRFDLPIWQSLRPAALLLSSLALLAVFRFKLGLGWVLGGSAALGVLHGLW